MINKPRNMHLIHHSEILVISGESYRMHEAKKRSAQKKPTRTATKKNKPVAQ